MHEVLEWLENSFTILVEYLILAIELVSVVILAVTVVKTVVRLLKHGKHIGIPLAEGMSLALEVAMCAEFLHTVIDSDWKSLLALGATIVLRAAMSLLLHFEKTNEKKEAKEEEE